MKIELLFLESFNNTFNGKEYKIYQFLDPKTLQVLSGTNLEGGEDLQVFESYKVTIGLKSGKLKVLSLV